MNYLAHILLSGDDWRWQLGGFLGDFLKGPLAANIRDASGAAWETEVLAGVQLHRRLDARVEALPEYQRCVALLGPDCRRVGGIAIDVLFDHLLVRHWGRFQRRPLSGFSRDFYDLCEQQRQRLPPRAARFIEAAARHDLFCGYADSEVIRGVLTRIAGRLRYPTNLELAGERALQRREQLLPLFLACMPRLLQFASEQRSQLLAEVPQQLANAPQQRDMP